LNLLKALANGVVNFTGVDAMQRYKLGTPHNVIKNKRILIKNDIIEDTNGKYEFLDPAFELWFNKQFFNQPYIIS
jgi:uncharacterized protein